MPYKILYDNDGDGICEYEIKMEPDWSVEEKINYKSGMTCKITDDMGAAIDKGKEIQLYSPTGIYLWGGVIVDIDDYEEIQGIRYYDLAIEDYSILATRSLAKIAYENKTVDYIVKDLINRYLGNTVNTDYDFGIREGTIEENLITLSNQIFNYLDIYQCLDILSQYGYIWNIDKDKKLNFHSIGYQVNDNILDNEAGTFSFYNFKRKRSIANYRNYQLTRGNKMLTNYREDEIPSPLPDGEVKSFTVKFPIAKTPRITVDGVDQSVGVNGIDSESDFDWFWSYESNIISCSDSAAAPGAGVEIRINYYGLVPILVGSKNPAEIAANGLYEHYTKNDNLNSIKDALFFTQELLKKYSETADKISFDLYEKVFSTMEQFKINHSVFNISNEMFFVESVTWDSSQIDENNIVYHYNVLDGAALGGWEEIFKNIFKPEYVETGAGDMIVVLEEWDDTMSYAGTYDITEYDDLLFPDDSLYPDDLLFPNSDSSNVLGGASD